MIAPQYRPMYFRPLTQRDTMFTESHAINGETMGQFINSITLRFRGQPQNLDTIVRHTLADIDPNLVFELKSLDDQVAANFNQERLIARLTMLFGIPALVIASVELYGVMSYSVARRTAEIGVRMAFGANRGHVVALVMRAAFSQVGLGILIGIPVALLVAYLAASQLYSVRAYDPVSLIIAALVLCISAAVAALIPATRAANMEPMKALRAE
jgi:ABC-type antimicrobial peptide transport system permease subunit